MFNAVLSLPRNTRGRDLFATDIHAQFHLLKQALSAVNFDKTCDRLFIGGDWIDRGRNSHPALTWAEQPYCFGVFGNHDAQHVFHRELDLFSQSLHCMPIDPWYAQMTQAQYNAYFDRFKQALHPGIEVETEHGLVAILHAELPLGETWQSAKTRLNAQDHDFLRACLWGRDLAKIAMKGGLSEADITPYTVDDVTWMLHCHTPHTKQDYQPYRLANRLYLDTAAYKAKRPEKYPTAGISLFDLSNPTRVLYSTGAQPLTLVAPRDPGDPLAL